MSDLKPCPFCGGKPHIREAMGETWVVCGSCNSSSNSKGRSTLAVDLWNRRPSLEPPASDVAGWRLVPVEPTREMTEAAHKSRNDGFTGMRSLWQAMIAAAPPHPASKDVGDE